MTIPSSSHLIFIPVCPPLVRVVDHCPSPLSSSLLPPGEWPPFSSHYIIETPFESNLSLPSLLGDGREGREGGGGAGEYNGCELTPLKPSLPQSEGEIRSIHSLFLYGRKELD